MPAEPSRRPLLGVIGMLAVAGLLLLAGFAAGGGPLLSSAPGVAAPRTTLPSSGAGPDRARVVPPRRAPPQPGGDRGFALPGWLWPAVGAAALAGAVAAAVAVVLRRRSAGPGGLRAALGAEALRRRRLQSGVSAALAELDEQGEPRLAVLACWVRLEKAFAAAGSPRAQAETSGEMARRILAEHAVNPQALDALHRGYRLARFSGGTVSEAMKDEARSALRLVASQLAETRRYSEAPG